MLLIIALTVLFLTPLFYYLPSAVLAAIIMVAVSGLFDAAEMKHLWKTDKRDLAMLLVTFIATLVLGIEEGIAIGVVLSLILVIYSSTKPHSAELGRLGETRNYRNIDRYIDAKINDEILIYRYDSSLYFANVEHFQETLFSKIEQRGEKLELVILDASAIHTIDSTGIHALNEIVKDLKQRGITFFIAGAIGPVRDKLKTCGIQESMGQENFFFDVSDAVACYKETPERIRKTFSPCQTNV
ncbi:SulP family inorganic anion transporter [Rhodohalobacter sp.]|uniref:SulP family inorganic anion transporter n=1 Tax=Rhodohalobacter sp. TaxID=1974210 RepID=UPI002ACEE78F|nr:STAS domain-containing protein [Rhodohalobacter sp.]MDZ7755131.1 STAS domain-containing protein [Rhodohalobacter sp.]